MDELTITFIAYLVQRVKRARSRQVKLNASRKSFSPSPIGFVLIISSLERFAIGGKRAESYIVGKRGEIKEART